MEEFQLAYTEQTIISVLILIILLIDLLKTFKRSVLRKRIAIFLIFNILYFVTQQAYKDINFYNFGSKEVIYATFILNYLLEISIRASLFLCAEYLMKSKIAISAKIEFVSLFFYYLTSLLIITTPITRLVFYVDDSLHAIRMPLYLIINLTSYFYVILVFFRALYCSIFTPNKKEKMLYISMLIFLTLPYLSLFIKLDIWNCTTALSVLVFYLIIQHENISKDPLTNLNDRQYLNQDIEKLLSTSKKNKLALLMIDADHFKEVNDTFGHLEGDNSLIRIARAITFATRHLRYVINARYGGDEFIVCFYETSENEAEAIAKKISKKLHELNISSNSGHNLTVSIGISKYDKDIHSSDDLIKRADAKLYEIKNNRKN